MALSRILIGLVSWMFSNWLIWSTSSTFGNRLGALGVLMPLAGFDLIKPSLRR